MEKSRWCAPVLFLTISIAVTWHQLYTIQTVSSYSHQNANNHYKRTKIAGVVLRKQSSLRIKMPSPSKGATIARGLPTAPFFHGKTKCAQEPRVGYEPRVVLIKNLSIVVVGGSSTG